MGWLALAAGLLLAACVGAAEVAVGASQELGEPTARALPLDDECRSAAADVGSCGLEALQRRSQAAHAVLAVLQTQEAADDSPEKELTPAEVEAEYARLLREGKLDRYLGSSESASEPLLGAAALGRREDSGSGLGEVFRGMLVMKLDAINRKLREAIPDSIENVYGTNTTSKVCCAGTWSTCWCHCELVETVQVRNLTHASSVAIKEVSDVTATPALDGPMHLAIGMGVSAEDLSIAGRAKRSLKACSHHMGSLRGGLWLEASMNGTANMSGVLVMKNGRMCFKCKSVHLHVLPHDVRFQREKVSIGGWNMLKLHGSFWNRVAHHLPTKQLISDMTKAADKAIPTALGHQDLCF